ncbi:ATP-binding cassette domain-containing protein [Spirulina sp. CS-785/01]|uniref:ATP-binding cassette domain-containing protein n=1 Tax=Spirulina sp. CS-785/01 TaxID=3021716 RepID=UPI002330DE4C|nr:ATP-binding cassette domain-containing protein [Spirulina sp. CS-785/01]MDB9311692.1 ATP-binding cassette domain-containing protein [Spirulina sp. CS-785/01]
MLSVPKSTQTPQKQAPIQVENLYKQYGNLTAVRGIHFTVQPGEIFGLIGPDGAGKTTTFQILAGVMEATSGTVQVLGKLPREARLDIGYLTQTFSLYTDLSITENLRYNAGLRRVPETVYQTRSQQLLQQVGLAKFSDRLAGQLSGGMKQKLALCCALIAQPQILLLDEPTTGVDPVSRREFWDLIASVAAEGVTVIAATPYLDEAERCHRIALIYNGDIQQIGTLQELRDSLGLHRLELRTPNVTQTEEVLQQYRQGKESKFISNHETQLVDVQSFGDRLDILVPNLNQGQTQIKTILAQENLPQPDIQPDDPTLENVFVTRLRQQGSDPPFIPFPRLNPPITDRNYPAIATQNLEKRFGEFRAVKGVDVTVQYGEIYGLLGANGAGKTTTIKMLCGLLPASGGTMQLSGETKNLHRSEVRSRIGYMSQKFTLYDDLTIRQNLEFYCGVYGVPRKYRQEKINWVLETCNLTQRATLLTGSLPGGWKQRVAFGASVMHEPEILFLDEPTSGVDPLARRQFWRLIRDFAKKGTAILVTTHYLEEAENCNRMGFMVAGEVVAQGSPSDIKSHQPGNLVELIVDDTQQASDLLKEQLDPWRVSIFGTRLHLVLEDVEQEFPPLEQRLQEANITIQSHRKIPFSLEDAFIGIVQRSNSL